MRRNLCSLLASFSLLCAAAQTMFIPDTHLRGWLNEAKPGSVDANGYCDTLAWNAVPPSFVSMDFSLVPASSTVDLDGMQYLKMATLSFGGGAGNDLTILWPGHPRANQSIMASNFDVSTISGFLPFPSTLGVFDCFSCGLTTIPSSFQGTGLGFFDVDFSGQTLYMPPSLTGLNLTRCNISSLPPLPPLNTLDLEGDSLVAFPAFPATLNNLYIVEVGLPTIPPLPAGLGNFTFKGNGTTVVPALPGGLSILDLSDNEITTLPSLPGSMWNLRLNHNPLTSLADLPDNIYHLECDSCPLTSIASFPAELQYATLEATPLSSLPEIPDLVTTLRLKGCDQLTCLPVLPQDLVTLRLYGTGVNCLPNLPPDLNTTGGQNNLGIAAVLCDPGNSLCPIVDPLVTGTVFNDADANGAFDVGENVRPFATVEAQPGNFLTGSNWNGEYVLPVDTGSFTVTGQPTLYEGTTTAPYAVNFASIGEVDSLNDIGYEVVPDIYDLVATLEAVPTRPGFETTVWVSVENVGTEATNAAVDFTFDGALEYVESSYMPQSQNGSLVEWNAGLLYPGASWTVEVTLYAPPGVAIGTPLVHAAAVAPDQSDATPPDNLAVLNDTTVGSYDPNDKRVMPEVMTPTQVSSGAPLTWTVRFQNTGTFAAERVLITDTLSADLRWNTMDVVASSHAHTWYILNGVLYVLFDDIDLPDSASDETGSHGFIKFGMKPQGALPDGAQVANRANIFFDFNEPVITAPAIFTVDATSGLGEANNPAWNIWPNPVEDALFIGGLPPEANTVLEVVDIHGVVVRTERNAPGTIHIDTHDLAASAYALRVSSGGTITTRTFIKR